VKLAFSTLGCPGWSLEEALAAAHRLDFGGLELRLLDGRLIQPPLEAAEIERVAALLPDSGVELVCLDSSIRLSAELPASQVAAELAAVLELAALWSSPMARVFPGEGDPKLVAEVLRQALPAAERLGVAIGVETHDGLNSARSLMAALALVPSPLVGVVWDMLHTHRAGETPREVLDLVGERLLVVHIKDAVRSDEAWRLMPLGEGEVPVREALGELRERGFSGWLVVEWEKFWHPELAEPQVALPQHARVLREWL
jgi:fatty-acyl-CoA synthase